MKVASYCSPKDVKYEKLLCGLLVFSKCAEGILFRAIYNKCSEKIDQYKKLKLKTPEQVYGALEINLPHNYEFIEDTEVYVFDSKKETRGYFSMRDYSNFIDEINETHPLMKGTLLHDIYSNKYEKSSDNMSVSSPQQSRSRSTPSKKSRSSSRASVHTSARASSRASSRSSSMSVQFL